MVRLGRYRVLVLLLIINIFNYIDRNALSGVSPLLKTAFGLSDVTIGALGSAFLLTYTLVAVPFGVWSDYWKPQKVAAIGVLVWSIACVATASATGQSQLFVWRSLVGVGEAAYVATAGTLISQRFDPDQRSKMLGVFNLGLPLGAALGVLLGGILGQAYGWQFVFIVVGLPGIILAAMTWLIRDDKGAATTGATAGAEAPGVEAGRLMVNGKKPRLRMSLLRFLGLPYWLVVAGYIGISYCFGAVINWLPMYMTRIWGYSLSEAATLSGAIIVVAGLLGAPAGGWIGDRWFKRGQSGRGYTLSLACMASAAFMWLGVGLRSPWWFGVSAFFMLWHVGVAAAMVFDTTPKFVWNSATALAMLFMHLLGDVPSSTITGVISDRYGLVTAFNLLPFAILMGGIAFGLSGYWQGMQRESGE